jgi:hypothetical protein
VGVNRVCIVGANGHKFCFLVVKMVFRIFDPLVQTLKSYEYTWTHFVAYKLLMVVVNDRNMKQNNILIK